MFKSVRRFAICSMVACIASVALPSCSEDDEPNSGTGNTVDLQSVFPYGNYKPSGVKSITYDSNGLVSAISTTNGKKVTFEYVGVTSLADDSYVLMIIEDSYERFSCKMTLNSAGYVKYCEETTTNLYDGDTWTDYWWFEYNSDGRLNYMKRSEGDNEVTTITYSNGDITAVKCRDDDGDGYDATISYTSDSVASAIENKGGIMLWDECFEIDMDEMAYAYYAGLLGKATKHLPVLQTTYVDDDGYGYISISTFTWTLNSDNLPTKLVRKEDGGYNDYWTFTW